MLAVAEPAEMLPGDMRWEAPYREHLVSLGLSPKTIRVYVQKVERAARWCRERGRQLHHLSAIDTARLADEYPHTNASRRQLRSALGHFWTMWGRTDPPLAAIRVPRKPRGRCRAVTEEVARALVLVSLGWYPEGTAVLAGLYLGLRASEIASIRWDRFDPGLAWYTVLGKMDVTAALPVHQVLRDELTPLRSAALHLFPGSRGRAHVTATTVLNWTARVADEVGVGPITTHVLRHTAIATVHDRTGDLRAAQAFARHSRPDTTAVYTRITGDRLVEAVASLDYLGEEVR